ncbi:hypothetical protein E2A64_14065 [Pseudohoeflea suaedae]|uniref:Uncharacterized protein n=1 Tax=Pseudohoeflea suaedae TaxID=877384 RepID=A0A4R5PJ24_9HYPH|nr:hypothetical protein [Pseudohoeflea suaedae]TDH34864.1 hypothetical protein E2A64_14065 [Pseudohoeflea suaedae]
MHDADFWTTVTDKSPETGRFGRSSAVKAAMLFAGVGIVSALILTPILAKDVASRLAFHPGAYDNIITGSISGQKSGRSYTIRKSVLQDSPDSICIIQRNGFRTGDC